MSKEDKKVIKDIAKRVLSYEVDAPEDIEVVKNNTSTNLTPRMRLILAPILRFHLPYDETQESFLESIKTRI